MEPQMDDRTFAGIRALVYQVAGLKLGDHKRVLVVSRLAKRVAHLGCDSFASYLDHVQRGGDDELREMINCLTTNKTDFFREPHHFDFLRERLVPELRARANAGGPRRVKVWSAGSSTGEEPYTIAMTLRDALGSGWDIEILASDIDTNVLAVAAAGAYPKSRVAAVPAPLRTASFREVDGEMVVRPELRALVDFRQVNLVGDGWPRGTVFDAIFCRNVTIYFDRPTQAKLYRRFMQHLGPDGYFFAGHSENLTWLPELLKPIGQTIYRAASSTARRGSHRPSRAPTAAASPQRAAARSRDPAWTASITSGEVFSSKKPAVVRTVLGSCVAACLWDAEAGVGGMNHFMLPDGNVEDVPARYGVHAMEVLVNELMLLGADRRRLRAKTFGGAAVLASHIGSRVGADNARFVVEFLKDERIPLVGQRLGGELPLEVRFQTQSGRAFVRALPRVERSILDSEEGYRARLRSEADARSGVPVLF